MWKQSKIVAIRYYSDTGVYIVKVHLSDTLGCKDTLQNSVHLVCPPLKAGFGIALEELLLTIQDSSTGAILAYWYSFGNGKNSSISSPSHTYSEYGTYEVQQVVKSYWNCQDRTSITFCNRRKRYYSYRYRRTQNAIYPQYFYSK